MYRAGDAPSHELATWISASWRETVTAGSHENGVRPLAADCARNRERRRPLGTSAVPALHRRGRLRPQTPRARSETAAAPRARPAPTRRESGRTRGSGGLHGPVAYV